MYKHLITGGVPLFGEVKISGAKNSALPILTACLLTDKPVMLSNVPHLNDVTTTMSLLGQMGVRLTVSDNMSIEVDAGGTNNLCAPYDLVSTMRASILVLGPLLARFGKASVSMPGGCAIGSRPVDLHILGLQQMGAIFDIENGNIEAYVNGKLKGTDYTFSKVTVTGTENLIMAATLAEGSTILRNCAKEPEIVDLCQFLIKLGAKIQGYGTDTITIEGVNELSGTAYTVLPDRVETGTFLVAAVMTGGRITARATRAGLLGSVLDKIKEAGAQVTWGEDWITVDMEDKRPKAIDLYTEPYPGFPTDMQAQFLALNVVAEGRGVITETVFENRFMHAPELKRMGAEIKLSGNQAHSKGMPFLNGAPVRATDLRASASLVLAGLVARGQTEVHSIYHIDRGYECIEEKLAQLGANIKRVPA